MRPTVSIVLPTYNGARYIRESIESCLTQTHGDLELIVVDDASADDTPEILRSYTDSRLRIVRHDQNRKLPAALNTGFAASRGEFLTWTSDDNRYRPTALETMLAALRESPEVGLVYAGYGLIDECGTLIRATQAEPPTMLSQKPVVGACFLYRRKVYEKVGGYNESMYRIEDYDYWLRVAQHFPLRALPDILYDYRVHPGSLTSQEGLRERALAFDRLHTRVYGGDRGRFRRHLAELHMSRAFEDYQAGRYDRVAGNVLKGLCYNCSFFWNRGVLAILFRSMLRRMA